MCKTCVYLVTYFEMYELVGNSCMITVEFKMFNVYLQFSLNIQASLSRDSALSMCQSLMSRLICKVLGRTKLSCSLNLATYFHARN